jgi:putative addiction module component (TIGR02574 family)
MPATVLPYDALLESSMSLPPQERSRLAARLIESLDDADDAVEISPAWREELDRRVEAVRNGTMRTLPHEEVMSEMRALIESIQAKQQAA